MSNSQSNRDKTSLLDFICFEPSLSQITCLFATLKQKRAICETCAKKLPENIDGMVNL